MTLITHIALEKIQIVISDSLCNIRNAGQDRECKKIFANDKLLIAKYGVFFKDLNVSFCEYLRDFPKEKDFDKFKDKINKVINVAKPTDETNFLLLNHDDNPKILEINNNELKELDLKDAAKSEYLPEWLFFSPVNNQNGEIDYKYQELLFKGLMKSLVKNGIEKIEDLDEKSVESFAVSFYSDVYNDRELQKESIGGKFISLAFSIDKNPWCINFHLEPVFKQPDLEDLIPNV